MNQRTTMAVDSFDDDFFSAEPADLEKEVARLTKELSSKHSEISDLHVLVDTLQTNLRSTVSAVDPDKQDSITEVQSFKWSLNWRPKTC